jgi:hypothetical protein
MFTSHQLPTELLFSHGDNAQAPWLSTQANKIHALITLSFSWRSRRPLVDSRIGYHGTHAGGLTSKGDIMISHLPAMHSRRVFSPLHTF